MSKECMDRDLILYKKAKLRVMEINSMLEFYKYDIVFNEASGEYTLRGKDNIGRILFIRTFTYCDRLFSYVSGMLHALEDKKLEESKDGE